MEVHPLFHCSRGRCLECRGALQAASQSQVLETLPPIIILKAEYVAQNNILLLKSNFKFLA